VLFPCFVEIYLDIVIDIDIELIDIVPFFEATQVWSCRILNADRWMDWTMQQVTML
jgi:hypothetical protein